MGEITNIPDKIYLQVDPEDWIMDDADDVHWSDLATRNEEITWCIDAINNSDIAYLRSTPERIHANQLQQASNDLLLRCQLADAQGDLSELVDGIYLDAMQAVLDEIKNHSKEDSQ